MLLSNVSKSPLDNIFCHSTVVADEPCQNRLSLKIAFRDESETSDNNISQNSNYSRPRLNSPDLNYEAGRESLRNRLITGVFVSTHNVSVCD